MDGDVGARVAAGDPLGELPAADRLRLQERAVAVVDVLQDAVGDVRPQLLVIGIGELVVDDLGEHAVRFGEALKLVEFLKRQDGRLLDQDVLAGLEGQPCRLEVAVVGRGDADGVDAGCRAGRPTASGPAKLWKGGELAGQLSLVAFGPRRPVRDATAASSTSTSPKSRRNSPSRCSGLEERPVGLVEDHPEADHAGPEAMLRSHAGMIPRDRPVRLTSG